jgi:hypothetical protein
MLVSCRAIRDNYDFKTDGIELSRHLTGTLLRIYEDMTMLIKGFGVIRESN